MKNKIYITLCIILTIILVIFVRYEKYKEIEESKKNKEVAEYIQDFIEKKSEDDLKIKSREEARQILKEYLKEKYNEEYTVNLPARNKNDDYIATAYIENDYLSTIRVAVNSNTLECRDSYCLKNLNKYFENIINDEISKKWDKSICQVNCGFRNEVSNKNRELDENPALIFEEEKENITAAIYIVINKDNIEKSKEAELIDEILKIKELNGLFCSLDVYYVDDVIYNKTLENIEQKELIISTECIENNNYNLSTFLDIDNTKDYTEDLYNSFK